MTRASTAVSAGEEGRPGQNMKSDAGQQAADRALDGLAGRDGGRQLVPPEGAAGEVGAGVVGEGDRDRGDHPERPVGEVAVQQRQRRPAARPRRRRRSRPCASRRAGRLQVARPRWLSTTASDDHQRRHRPQQGQLRAAGRRRPRRPAPTTTRAARCRPWPTPRVRPPYSARADRRGQQRQRGEPPGLAPEHQQAPAAAARPPPTATRSRRLLAATVALSA